MTESNKSLFSLLRLSSIRKVLLATVFRDIEAVQQDILAAIRQEGLAAIRKLESAREEGLATIDLRFKQLLQDIEARAQHHHELCVAHNKEIAAAREELFNARVRSQSEK